MTDVCRSPVPYHRSDDDGNYLLKLDAEAWKAIRDRHCPPKCNDRPPCRWDPKCRRSDPVHRLYYSHPEVEMKDLDLDANPEPLPAPMERRVCSKGEKCDRRDLVHFLWYSHPDNLDDAHAAALEARASTDGDEGGDACPVCFYPLEPSTAVTLQCGGERHRFCDSCINTLLRGRWATLELQTAETANCPLCNTPFLYYTRGRCASYQKFTVSKIYNAWDQAAEAAAAEAEAQAAQLQPPAQAPIPNAAAPLSDAEVQRANDAAREAQQARVAQQVGERATRAVNRTAAAAAASAAAAAAQSVQPAAAPVVAPAASAAAQPAAAQPAASNAASSSSLSEDERRRRLLNLIQAGHDRIAWSSLDEATRDKLLHEYNKALGLPANALLPGVVLAANGLWSVNDITVVITSLNDQVLAQHGLGQIPSGQLGDLKKDMHCLHSLVRRAGLEGDAPYVYPIYTSYQPRAPSGQQRPRFYFFLWSAQSFEERKTRAGALTQDLQRLKELRRTVRRAPNESAIRELLRQGFTNDPITGLPLPNPGSPLFQVGWEALREVVEAINCSGSIAHGRIEEVRAKLQQIKAATLTGEAGSS